jgi:hypothetical protein
MPEPIETDSDTFDPMFDQDVVEAIAMAADDDLGADDIPRGSRCYRVSGKNGMVTCPFWTLVMALPDGQNGFCAHMNLGDWQGETVLHDHVKICGIKLD